jgi:lysophospholipase L1-like esterase
MKTALALALAFGAAAACGGPEPPRVPRHAATTPVPREEPEWLARHAELCARSNRDAQLVFIGDSITQGWEAEGREAWSEFYADREAVELGIGGDRTQHVLWRVENGALAGLRPALVVLMVGTNNTGDDAPRRIADGVIAVAGALWQRLPRADILVLGIFPRGADDTDPRRQAAVATNRLLADIGARFEDRRVSYLDIGARFLEQDGSLSPDVMPDLLHLSPRGYRIWAEAIEAEVADRLGARR